VGRARALEPSAPSGPMHTRAYHPDPHTVCLGGTPAPNPLHSPPSDVACSLRPSHPRPLRGRCLGGGVGPLRRRVARHPVGRLPVGPDPPPPPEGAGSGRGVGGGKPSQGGPPIPSTGLKPNPALGLVPEMLVLGQGVLSLPQSFVVFFAPQRCVRCRQCPRLRHILNSIPRHFFFQTSRSPPRFHSIRSIPSEVHFPFIPCIRRRPLGRDRGCRRGSLPPSGEL